MSLNPLFVPKPPSRDNWMWATVTQTSPLRVRFDGEATAVDATPDTLLAAATLAVDDRVWVQIFGNSMVIVGKAHGGSVQDPSFDAEVTAPSFVATGDITGDDARFNIYNWNGNSMKVEGVNGADYLGFLTSAGAAGRIKVGGVTIAGNYATKNAANLGLYVEGRVDVDGEFYSLGVYNATSTFTANVGIASSPAYKFYRLTSSKRYKVAIQPEDVTDEQILALQPKSYIDKAQFTATQGKPEQVTLPRYLGLIAEDVAQVDGLKDLLVTYSTVEGLGVVPDAVSYDRVGVALIPVVQRLLQRVAELEQRLGP